MDRRVSELEDLRKLRDLVVEMLQDEPSCSFWACPGDRHPMIGMATCNVCGPRIEMRLALGETIECLGNCGICGTEQANNTKED